MITLERLREGPVTLKFTGDMDRKVTITLENESDVVAHDIIYDDQGKVMDDIHYDCPCKTDEELEGFVNDVLDNNPEQWEEIKTETGVKPAKKFDETKVTVLASKNGYYLTRQKSGSSQRVVIYSIYTDDDDKCIKRWVSDENLVPSEDEKAYEGTRAWNLFLSYADPKPVEKKETPKSKGSSFGHNWWENDIADDDDDYDYVPKYHYHEPVRTKGLAPKLKNSDTLVIHCADHSTDMLAQIYEGKGWDVLRDGNIDRDELKELLECHTRFVFLGHGTPAGLINVQGGGYVIDSSNCDYLKGKKIFAIWCYAATFFKNNGFKGSGILCSDNAPSEVWECAAACNAHVSAPFILENITYWSKCMADAIELGWTNPEAACQQAKEEFYKSMNDERTDDEKKVIEFNTNTIQVV